MAQAQAIPVMPNVTTKHYPIVIPKELHERIWKETKGEGGWQSLMSDIKNCTDPDAYVMEIPDPLLRRLIPYAVKFGSGGYQSLIRWVLCLILEQHMVDLIGAEQTLKAKHGGKGAAA